MRHLITQRNIQLIWSVLYMKILLTYVYIYIYICFLCMQVYCVVGASYCPDTSNSDGANHAKTLPHMCHNVFLVARVSEWLYAALGTTGRHCWVVLYCSFNNKTVCIYYKHMRSQTNDVQIVTTSVVYQLYIASGLNGPFNKICGDGRDNHNITMSTQQSVCHYYSLNSVGVQQQHIQVVLVPYIVISY